jgi:hypothetical protein
LFSSSISICRQTVLDVDALRYQSQISLSKVRLLATRTHGWHRWLRLLSRDRTARGRDLRKPEMEEEVPAGDRNRRGWELYIPCCHEHHSVFFSFSCSDNFRLSPVAADPRTVNSSASANEEHQHTSSPHLRCALGPTATPTSKAC